MTNKDRENLAVSNIYYVQSPYDVKSCYKVQVVEIIDDNTVLVKWTTKKKKGGKEAKPFKLNISKLHTKASKAVGGYRQKH